MHRSLILPAAGSTTPKEDLSCAREAASCGVDTVWVGERSAPSSPARLAALAAAVPSIRLGMGLVPLSARGAAQLEETLTTLSLLAHGRVELGFDVPDSVTGSVRPPWVNRLADLAPVVRRAQVPLVAAVSDVATAAITAPYVDRLVLLGADPVLTGQVSAAVRGLDCAPRIEVWLDLAMPEDDDLLRAVVAERLAMPGVPGHATARRVVKRLRPGLRGDIGSAYARGALAVAAESVPDDLLRATTLTVGCPERMQAHLDAGAHGIAVRARGRDHSARRAVLAAWSTEACRTDDGV